MAFLYNTNVLAYGLPLALAGEDTYFDGDDDDDGDDNGDPSYAQNELSS